VILDSFMKQGSDTDSALTTLAAFSAHPRLPNQSLKKRLVDHLPHAFDLTCEEKSLR